jgi:hypothetical protein
LRGDQPVPQLGSQFAISPLRTTNVLRGEIEMRRHRPIILLVLAILASIQNIFWSVPSFAQVPLSSSSVNFSYSHRDSEKLRLKGAELQKTYNQYLSPLVESTRSISPNLAATLKDNFFGMNWYFTDFDPKNSAELSDLNGYVWLEKRIFLSKIEAERRDFFLKQILVFEFRRSHGQLHISDESQLDNVIKSIVNPRASIDSLGSALDQADLLQNEKLIWSNQLFLQDEAIPNNQNDGVLFSRKGLRFIMRHCDSEALFDIRARQLESGHANYFAGLRVILERLTHSGVCSSVDDKLYTIPLKVVQVADNKIRLDLKRQNHEGTPIFWTSWFAWIGTFELVVNSQVIRIIRQPALKRFVFEIILGGALSGTAAVAYKVYENKKAPVTQLSTEEQLKLLADLNRVMNDAPIGYYKMQSSEFLKQTQQSLNELASHGFLEMVLLRRPSK